MTAPTPAPSESEALIRSDVDAYLLQHERKDLLRLLTCGSVDDGKSTLIGRLLYDTKMIYEDQLAAIIRDSAVHGTTDTDFDPALLTDGLKAEREQGITIDVAYRYFSTDRRKFIIADTPGHEQYTRNMVTGASTCDLAIILIDARYGVLEQTRRHSFIASLLGIRHVVIAVNKMDLVAFSQTVFENIRRDYEGFAAKLHIADMYFLPISALRGDNVVDRSTNIPWFDGAPLLSHLETVPVSGDRNLIDMRFPVQHVIRPHLNFRGYAGTIASGVIRKGDDVMVLPSKRTSRIKSIVTFDGDIDEAFAPMAVTVTLEHERDVSRGDMLVHPKNVPHFGHDFDAILVWMNEDALKLDHQYLIKCTTNLVPGTINQLQYRFDINTLHRASAETLHVNEIGRVSISVTRPIAYDSYSQNRSTGAFIVIDRATNGTVGAGMILERGRSVQPRQDAESKPVSDNIRREGSLVTNAARAKLLRQKPATLWLTGLSGSGKSTIAQALEQHLMEAGHACFVLDGDNIRHGLNRDLGFSAEDRSENIRRVAEVARLFNDAGIIVITSFISPYREDRTSAAAVIGPERFFEVFVDTPIEVCEQRDPKGLYKKARAGEIDRFTGVSAPYEAPEAPVLTLSTTTLDVAACVARVLDFLKQRSLLPQSKDESTT
ncbi:MAG: sulfate adenylyltransferase subunit CysN [Verrucomicrobia bacterium]|nr:sulfate adenylyltransferase subunit CysN [Verrucomicrobiota bacterium]